VTPEDASRGAEKARAKAAVLLMAHGTVERLEDLPPFLTAIRRGHPAPPELVAEVRRRYEAIGGQSPLNAVCREVARKLEARIGVPVRLALRLWSPSPKDVLAELANEGVERVAVVPLAQHSAHVYAQAAESAAREIAAGGGPSLSIVSAKNWGQDPLLTGAFAHEVRRALSETEPTLREATLLLFTAHSLPVAVLRAGDPYETEVRASARAISEELTKSGVALAASSAIAFQSQGMGGGEWLGPDLVSALDGARASGKKHVLVAPIGFLADHVEILYDLDIEAAALAKERGLSLSRTRSLNSGEGLLSALERVARPLLA
jgi:protoporphyrin/coproporphyrin ferrochelatase